MAWPMPRAAPVTRLTLPVNSHFMSGFPWGSGHQPRPRILDPGAKGLQKPGGRGSVHQAMVERQAQDDLVARQDVLADDHGSALNPADPQDGALGLVDDRREGVDPKRPEV